LKKLFINEKKFSFLYKIIGKPDEKQKYSEISVSASSISEITGIPRATCIRKLEILLNMGILLREAKSKKYYVNPTSSKRTSKIITKENVDFAVQNWSDYLSVILNAIYTNR